jgi:mannose-6-phosphate isomerase-like protein (cupin superfamily)
VDVRTRERDAEPFTTKDGSTIREYLHTELQSLAEATVRPGDSTRSHFHAVSEEIYLVLEGEGTMELDGVEGAVGPGDAVLIAPGAWHRISAGASELRFLCCCAPPYSDDDTYFA